MYLFGLNKSGRYVTCCLYYIFYRYVHSWTYVKGMYSDRSVMFRGMQIHPHREHVKITPHVTEEKHKPEEKRNKISTTNTTNYRT